MDKKELLTFTFPEELIDRVSTIYVLEGTPSPLQRARFFKRGVYDSQKQEKLLLGLKLRNQHNSDKPLSGVLHFNITFHFPYPSHPKTREKLTKQFFHIYKPDLSNLIKMIEDICVDTEIITDDSIIASMFSAKVYSDKPKTTFQIISLKGDNEN
jgi:Holliday junction resolvase RusA-like endonuclease